MVVVVVGGSQLHWYEYDAEAAARATSLLSFRAPSLHTHRQTGERGERGHCIHGNGRAAVGSS